MSTSPIPDEVMRSMMTKAGRASIEYFVERLNMQNLVAQMRALQAFGRRRRKIPMSSLCV
jgi:hypothetical protein